MQRSGLDGATVKESQGRAGIGEGTPGVMKGTLGGVKGPCSGEIRWGFKEW